MNIEYRSGRIVPGQIESLIVLDRAQSLAHGRAAIEPVQVAGFAGSGKSTLANAIAVATVQAGLVCVLAGRSLVLDQPVQYRLSSHCHPVLARRAQIDNRKPPHAGSADPVAARGRLDPRSARIAQRVLDRARELLTQHALQPDEIERTLVAGRIEAADLLAVAAQDAARAADMLWSGERRQGRSLQDVEMLLNGRLTEVAPEREALALILADDDGFEQELGAILANAERVEEERAVGAAIAGLRRRVAPDKTLAEVHRHTVWMGQVLSEARDLVNMSGSPEAVLRLHSGALGAQAVRQFLLQRPADDAAAAIMAFETWRSEYEADAAALAPHLDRYGARAVASIASRLPNPFPSHRPQAGSFSQAIREARYGARSLPGVLDKLRAIVPPSLWREIAAAPLEEAATRLAKGTALDARTQAANEVRQLRDIFASTGFGDLLAAPSDFATRNELVVSESTGVAGGRPITSPQVLDILLDTGVPEPVAALTEWPAALTRAKTMRDLAEAATRGGRIDVLVTDDPFEFEADLLDRFVANGTRVHRIGVDGSASVRLDIPHRQRDAALADIASERPGRWLGEPGGMGVVVREAPGTDLEQLRSLAGRLVDMLRNKGSDAALAAKGRIGLGDVLVAAVDVLDDTVLRSLARSSRDGLMVLCRKDVHGARAAAERPLSPEAVLAQSLGWRVRRAAFEGVILEKDGRSVVLVDEPVVFAATDEMVTDVADRLAALGWRPVIAWRDAPREAEILGRLLDAQAVTISSDHPFRSLTDNIDLSRQGLSAAGQGASEGSRGGGAERGTRELAAPSVAPAADAAERAPAGRSPEGAVAPEGRDERRGLPVRSFAEPPPGAAVRPLRPPKAPSPAPEPA
jgi:hypothetical protein